MRVSAKTDYALRALLVLAEHDPALVKVEALSAAEDMPRKFVEIILSELRRAGIVVSRRGTDGGYGLAVPPERITIGAVIRVLDGPLGEKGARSHQDGTGAVRLGEVWSAATASVASVVDATTLAHLVSGQLPDHVRQLARSAPPDADRNAG